ncbi:AarF/ABC1/UbiB kinase family protein [Caloramator sp. E03]|uniref:ABC1 kinase family protein n=1 Tax=Caloramator sp. E03 TaxID=2576307 RepID=UPI00111084D6|nr:AarF/ABC1/UbiB kinase family protein [Caloramator sp. E03]QCX33713.1 AarF/ABC1/UbiB kinase family protein [Caloramator sp. E03]
MSNRALLRFKQIIKVMAKYGFGYIVDNKINSGKNSPFNLKKAFEELGPTFIKIGQILSTRPDILPEEYIIELQKLQDNTSYCSFEEIKKIFYKELKKDIYDVFDEFGKVPIASASIAQAHKAILKDGRKVIIKIQRPNIEEDMELDIAILKRIVNLTKARFKDTLIDPLEALDEILLSTRRELNFKNEARCIEKFKELNEDVKFVSCPEIIWSLTTKKIIAMEYIDGIKISDLNSLKEEGYDLNDIGKKLALSYFKQIFKDGFFHGDPHPGNIIIKNNKIYYIDFGIMGTLSPPLRNALNEAIIAIALNDIDKLIQVIMTIGIKKGMVNKNKLYEDIDSLFLNYLSTSLKNIKISSMLQDIFNAAKQNNIQLPKDLTLLIRGLVIIEGVVAKISPDINILDIAIPYVKSNIQLHNIPSFNEIFTNTYSFSKSSMELPSKLIKLCNFILNGRAKVQLEHRNLTKQVLELNKMVNRLIFAIITSSFIIGSSLILNTNIGPKIFGISLIGITGYIAAAFLGFWLLISILRSGKL